MWCHPDLSKGLDILKESAQPDLQHLRREAATVAASIFRWSLLAQGLSQKFVNATSEMNEDEKWFLFFLDVVAWLQQNVLQPEKKESSKIEKYSKLFSAWISFSQLFLPPTHTCTANIYTHTLTYPYVITDVLTHTHEQTHTNLPILTHLPIRDHPRTYTYTCTHTY